MIKNIKKIFRKERIKRHLMIISNCYREIMNLEMYDTKICSFTNIKMQVGQFFSSVTDGLQISNRIVPISELAKNEGLGESDFLEWYKYYSNKKVGIIHFTEFEY